MNREEPAWKSRRPAPKRPRTHDNLCTVSDRPTYHHGDLRQALIQACLDLVAETQGWKFSLRAASRRAGVSSAAPYSHFAGKLELLAAVAAKGFRILGEHMTAATGPVDRVEDALVAMRSAYVKFGTDNPGLYRLMFGSALEGLAGPATELAEAAAATLKILKDVIACGLPAKAVDGGPEEDDLIERLVLSHWAHVHGLTMLMTDGLAKTRCASDIERMMQMDTHIDLAGPLKKS